MKEAKPNAARSTSPSPSVLRPQDKIDRYVRRLDCFVCSLQTPPQISNISFSAPFSLVTVETIIICSPRLGYFS